MVMQRNYPQKKHTAQLKEYVSISYLQYFIYLKWGLKTIKYMCKIKKNIIKKRVLKIKVGKFTCFYEVILSVQKFVWLILIKKKGVKLILVKRFNISEATLYFRIFLRKIYAYYI